MSPTRALVARKGRKQHFATLLPGTAAWIPVCDVSDVPVFGATVVGIGDWNTWLAAAEHDDGAMCSRCRTPLLVAAYALREVEGIRARTADITALEDEVRTLRAEVARWTTAALGEVKDAVARRRARR